jgi:DNA-binding XRE family transcriptional regulator
MNERKLKSVRALKGLTQKEIAKEMGVNEATYNRKEIGTRQFAILEIIQVARILGLNVDDVNEIFFDNILTKCSVGVD